MNWLTFVIATLVTQHVSGRSDGGCSSVTAPAIGGDGCWQFNLDKLPGPPAYWVTYDDSRYYLFINKFFHCIPTPQTRTQTYAHTK